MAYTCVHVHVFKFSVQTLTEDLEIDEFLLKQTMTNQKKITGENAFSFTQPYTSHLYRFKFNRAYIMPEPNQNQHHRHCLWKGKTKCNHYFFIWVVRKNLKKSQRNLVYNINRFIFAVETEWERQIAKLLFLFQGIVYIVNRFIKPAKLQLWKKERLLKLRASK